MPNPGLTFKDTVIPGLIQEIQWGTWYSDMQEAHVFAVEGTSSTEGRLAYRDVMIPLIYSGFANQKLRDDSILVIEKLATKVGSLQIRVAGGTIIFDQAVNMKLLGIQRGRSGADGAHFHYRELLFMFRQLATS